MNGENAGETADVEDLPHMRGQAAEGELGAAGTSLLRRFQKDAQPRRADVLQPRKVQDDARLALDFPNQDLVQVLGGVAAQTTLNRQDQNVTIHRFAYLHRSITSSPSGLCMLVCQPFYEAQPISLIFTAIAKTIHESPQKMHAEAANWPRLQWGVEIRHRHLQRIECPPIVFDFDPDDGRLAPEPDPDLPLARLLTIAVADDIGH